jgi:hypothetical protein
MSTSPSTPQPPAAAAADAADAPSAPVHHDAYLSDIVVVCDETPEVKIDDIVKKLQTEEMSIANVDRDNCVIEGTCDASKIHKIDDFPGVAYVRSVFTYVADYPAGDPRDRDKVTREW